MPDSLPLRPTGADDPQATLDRLAAEVSAAPSAIPTAPMVPVGQSAPPVHRYAPTPAQAAPVLPPVASAEAIETITGESSVDLDVLLTAMIEMKGSDLHLTVASAPKVRVSSRMQDIPGQPTLTGEMIRKVVYGILTSRQQGVFEEKNELDLAHTVPGVSRFRVNVFKQRGEVGAVFRAIPWEILSLNQLNMPEVVRGFAHLERGLVLVTGPTGSGKSTTLAAVIDEINRTRQCHIMTIEDPIEFEHGHKGSIINQREVGEDTHSFADALKHVLRQDPDVIMVGELRDLETISTALTAAETGHLVFATLHTSSASETISRVVDVFPAEQQNQILTQLGATLQAVVCQTLVRRRDGKGRVAAAEIMVCDDGIKNQIRKNQLHMIPSTMQTSRASGMQTLDKHLSELAMAGTIAYQDGLEKAANRNGYVEFTGGEEAVQRRLNASAAPPEFGSM